MEEKATFSSCLGCVSQPTVVSVLPQEAQSFTTGLFCVLRSSNRRNVRLPDCHEPSYYGNILLKGLRTACSRFFLPLRYMT